MKIASKLIILKFAQRSFEAAIQLSLMDPWLRERWDEFVELRADYETFVDNMLLSVREERKMSS